jgi:hypothetical protein
MIAPENPSQNQTLSLVDASDLSALTIEQAHSLMGRNGWLRLDSLMSLSSDVAEVLARHEGGLGFGMLNSVSEETEEFLAGHKGELDIRFLKELKSRALATKLAGQPSWSEGQLLHISDAAAEGLVTHAGRLGLNVTALHNLSPHAQMLLETHNRLYPPEQRPAEPDYKSLAADILRDVEAGRIRRDAPIGGLRLFTIYLLLLARLAIYSYAFFYVTFELKIALNTKLTLASLLWPIICSLWPYFVADFVLRVVAILAKDLKS